MVAILKEILHAVFEMTDGQLENGGMEICGGEVITAN